MIHLSLREDCNEIYDYQNLTIKKDVLNHKLSLLKPLFTKEYVKLIENMGNDLISKFLY